MPIPSNLMPTPAVSGYNLCMIMVAIFAEMVLIFLQFLVLAINRAASLLHASIYILIQFTETLIGDIGPQQLTSTDTETGKSINSCQVCK